VSTGEFLIRPSGWLSRWWSHNGLLGIVVLVGLALLTLYMFSLGAVLGLFVGAFFAICLGGFLAWALVYDRLASVRVKDGRLTCRGIFGSTSFATSSVDSAAVVTVKWRRAAPEPVFLLLDHHHHCLLKLAPMAWGEEELESLAKALGVAVERDAKWRSPSDIDNRYRGAYSGWQRAPQTTGILIALGLVPVLLLLLLVVVPAAQRQGLIAADRLDLTVTGGANVRLAPLAGRTGPCTSSTQATDYSINLTSGNDPDQWRFEVIIGNFKGAGTYQLPHRDLDVLLIGPGANQSWTGKGEVSGTVTIHSDNSGAIDAMLVGDPVLGKDAAPVHVVGTWSCVLWSSSF
jgi:hypothetical protein